jgi:peptidoglycan/LPS O-acetylase OafA/YrhL
MPLATPALPPPAAAPRRFTYVDALRGLAALAVAGGHFYSGLWTPRTGPLFPRPLHQVLTHGNVGVEIFFVISGFVMAYSLRQARIGPRFFGLFLLRRSLRLDPPYWATIALAVVLAFAAGWLRSRPPVLPTWPQVLLHLVYLQDLAGAGDIVEVFWTLCMEVQFYLAFALLLGLSQRLAGRGRAHGVVLGVFVPLTVLSLAVQFGFVPWPYKATMVKFWYLFQLGALACWAVQGTIRARWFLGYVAALLALLAVSFTVESLVGVLTGASLFLIGRLGRLHDTLGHRPLQHLGRLSYSLYLVHPLVGVPFCFFVRERLVGASPSLAAGAVLFALAVGVSVAFAEVFHRLVERPALGWSQRVRLPSAAAAGAPAVTPPAASGRPTAARACGPRAAPAAAPRAPGSAARGSAKAAAPAARSA